LLTLYHLFFYKHCW